MNTFFVPYFGNTPKAVEIKGHRLLILASNLEDMQSDLDEIGGTEVRTIEIEGNPSDALSHLAESVKGGVILSPPGVMVSTVIHSLEQELPWVH